MENGDFSIVFSVQGTGGSPTGPDPENRVGDQETGSPVSSGLQVPSELGHCRAKTRHPCSIFPSKCPLISPAEKSNILLVDSLALWKIINEKDAILIPNN